MEVGTYQLPVVAKGAQSTTLAPDELALILSGIDLTSVRRRKRFSVTAEK